jgi:hypothetical protein
MSNLESLSTATLRAKARALIGWRVRHYHNWNRRIGNAGFIVLDTSTNAALVVEPLGEQELREWLIAAVRAVA